MRTTFVASRPAPAVLLGTALLGVFGMPLHAQAADEILRCIEESVVSMRGGCEDTPAIEWTHVVRAPESYPDEFDALLAGLEDFASFHESRSLRSYAIGVLTMTGQMENPRSGEATAALANVFDAVDNDVVRAAIVQRMRYQTDERVVLAFLEHAAGAEPSNNSGYSPGAESVRVLSEMGAEGRTVLARLHSSRTLRDPGVRLRLDELVKTGFRRPH